MRASKDRARVRVSLQYNHDPSQYRKIHSPPHRFIVVSDPALTEENMGVELSVNI